MREHPQHEDLGLIDDDRTEDLRKPVCRLCGNTGWRPGPMAVIPCNHRGVVGQLPEMQKAPAATEALRIDQPCSSPTVGELACSHHNHQGDLPTMKPHIQRLDDAVNRIDLIRADINAVIRDMPEDVPMFALVDIVNGLWNLRNASCLLDKATDTLEADAQAVRS